MNAANRVAMNTGILYIRMLLTMGISLYTTRLVLNALGSTDFGIYNLVAGIIVMLSFLNTAMATSSQRYLSFHQGRNDFEKQKEVFTNSFFLHILIGVFLVIVLEFIGLFLFDGFLQIPENRVESAKIIYHYMALTVFFTVITVPFNGLLISHENMLWVAFVNILETLLKLGIAILLYFLTRDKLIWYGILTASIIIFTFIVNAVFCLKKYPECTFRGVMKPEKGFLVELTSFAGWNLFGALCSMGRNEGLALILNIFFGTVVNAAYGIANQVSSQLLFFSRTMLRALNPQIMKSEGMGDRKRMLRLSMMASKFGFFLLSLFAIPIIFEMPQILSFWLKNVPVYTVTFCRLILIGALFNQLTIGIQSALQAEGNIKIYQILVGSIILLNLPLAYCLLAFFKFPPYSVLISYIIIEFIACVFRLLVSRKQLDLSISVYFDKVIKLEILPVFIICIINIGSIWLFEMHYRFILVTAISMISYLFLIYYFGIDLYEKKILFEIFQKVKTKLKIKND